jgi:hypothetical protein
MWRITPEITSADPGAKNNTQMLSGVWLIDGLAALALKIL